MEKRKRQYSYKYNGKDSEYPLDGMLTVLCLLCNIRAPPEVFSKSHKKERRTPMEAKENKKSFKNVGNLGRSDCEYIIEAQNPHQNFLNEEKTVMPDTKLTVNQFKKKVRVSLYNLKVNLYKLITENKKEKF